MTLLTRITEIEARAAAASPNKWKAYKGGTAYDAISAFLSDEVKP